MAGVAQLVEQLIRNQQVGGSNPPVGSSSQGVRSSEGDPLRASAPYPPLPKRCACEPLHSKRHHVHDLFTPTPDIIQYHQCKQNDGFRNIFTDIRTVSITGTTQRSGIVLVSATYLSP